MMIASVVALAAIIIGVVALEAVRPQLDTSELVVEDLPPLAIDEDRECVRLTDDAHADPVVEGLRRQLSRGDRVGSTQVTSCPAAFDGLEVTYVGEVVGELLPRRGGAWAQVNDDAYALEVGPVVGDRHHAGFNTGLAVWLPDGLHQRIDELGRPGQRGDVILVRGTLYRTDPDAGGGLTIRADEMETLAGAVQVESPLHVPQLVVAGTLALLAVVSLLWARRVRQR